MGMSASQARLLSITSRLTNNEFRAQTITNSKLRLATESQEASQAYMDALNSQQIMFLNYDDNGSASKVDLTPAVLYDYASMKNQYMITNSAGKYIVSNVDAQNFENSDDLFGFLKKYDLSYDVTDDINQKIDDEWQIERDKLYKDYLIEFEQWKIDDAEWQEEYGSENTTLYNRFVSVVGTYKDMQDLTGAPQTSKYCYYNGLHGNYDCYLHLLNHLIGYDGSLQTVKCTTTTGANFTTNAYKGLMDDYLTQDDINLFIEISEGIEDPYITADGSDKFTPYYYNSADPENPDADILEWTDNEHGVKDNLNIIQQKIDAGEVPTTYEQLKSDYKYDTSSGKPKAVLKTLKEKLVDLYYIMKNGKSGTVFTDEDRDQIKNDMKDLLINFTEGDLKMVSIKEPPVKPEWHEPDPPQHVEGIAFLRDQEKSQWYINLWHAMNGSETSNTVDPINFDNDVDYINNIPQEIRSEYRFIVENKTKDTKTTNYEILDINLNNSSEWLQFALSHGIVTLQQAQYYNPDEDSNKTANLNADGYKWNNIVYTSARDFVQQDNEKAIAIAEVKYKKRITEIENQDTKFDQDLKKLDTEHSALQTEYESIKEVLSKNVDRSFKAFS